MVLRLLVREDYRSPGRWYAWLTRATDRCGGAAWEREQDADNPITLAYFGDLPTDEEAVTIAVHRDRSGIFRRPLLTVHDGEVVLRQGHAGIIEPHVPSLT